MTDIKVFIVVWILDGLEKVDIFPDKETATEFWNTHGGNTYFRTLHIDDSNPTPPGEPIKTDTTGYTTLDVHDGEVDEDALWHDSCGCLVRRKMIYRHNQFHLGLLAKIEPL